MTTADIEQTEARLAQDSADSRGPLEGSEAFLRVLRQRNSKRAVFQRGLELVAQRFDAPLAAIRVDIDGGTIEDFVASSDSVRNAWRSICDGLLLSARYRQLSLAKFYQADGYEGRLAALATTLHDGERGISGAMAIVLPCSNRAMAQSNLAQLNALATVISAVASNPKSERAASQPGRSVDPSGLARAGSFKSSHEFGFSIANSLKSKIGCDQVALGMVRRGGVRVMCVSGRANFMRNTTYCWPKCRSRKSKPRVLSLLTN